MYTTEAATSHHVGAVYTMLSFSSGILGLVQMDMYGWHPSLDKYGSQHPHTYVGTSYHA